VISVGSGLARPGSQFGTRVTLVAVPLFVVISLGGGPIDLGVLRLAAGLPIIVGPLAGVLLEGRSRLPQMVRADIEAHARCGRSSRPLRRRVTAHSPPCRNHVRDRDPRGRVRHGLRRRAPSSRVHQSSSFREWPYRAYERARKLGRPRVCRTRANSRSLPAAGLPLPRSASG
jgi:hypothetical protein